MAIVVSEMVEARFTQPWSQFYAKFCSADHCTNLSAHRGDAAAGARLQREAHHAELLPSVHRQALPHLQGQKVSGDEIGAQLVGCVKIQTICSIWPFRGSDMVEAYLTAGTCIC